MRGLTVASLLVLAAVSAAAGTITAVVMVGNVASVCMAEPPSPDDDSPQNLVFRRATFERHAKALPGR